MKTTDKSPFSPPARRRSLEVTKVARAAGADPLCMWLHAGLLDLPRSSAILAIGTDAPVLVPRLAEYSDDVTVLDTSGDPVAAMARCFPDAAFLRHTPSNPLPFARETFDAIWCGGLLDRLIDPRAALGEMHRVLTPRGRLLVTLPDQGAIRKVLALFRWEERFARWRRCMRTFTRGTLACLAQECGFGEIHTSTGAHLRPVNGGPIPRLLRLKARKGPGVRLIRPAQPARCAAHVVELQDAPVFVVQGHAA